MPTSLLSKFKTKNNEKRKYRISHYIYTRSYKHARKEIKKIIPFIRWNSSFIYSKGIILLENEGNMKKIFSFSKTFYMLKYHLRPEILMDLAWIFLKQNDLNYLNKVATLFSNFLERKEKEFENIHGLFAVILKRISLQLSIKEEKMIMEGQAGKQLSVFYFIIKKKKINIEYSFIYQRILEEYYKEPSS